MKQEKDQNTQVLTNQTNDYLGEFEAADNAYHLELQKFELEHAEEIAALDELREARNKALDDVKKSLREDASHADYQKIQLIRVGKFKVQKKWTNWFNTEGFVQMAKDQGDNIFKSALDAGVIQEITTIDFKLAEAWLERNNLTKSFQQLKDGKEITPAVYGPKEILAIGEEVK